MEVQAITRFARMSPLKVRDVAREIQGRTAGEAAALLDLIPRKSARLLAKTLKSAMANAENNFNLPADEMVIHRALVDEGPAFRRFRPASRGSAHPYKKRTSHIKIVLTDETPAEAAVEE